MKAGLRVLAGVAGVMTLMASGCGSASDSVAGGSPVAPVERNVDSVVSPNDGTSRGDDLGPNQLLPDVLDPGSFDLRTAADFRDLSYCDPDDSSMMGGDFIEYSLADAQSWYEVVAVSFPDGRPTGYERFRIALELADGSSETVELSSVSLPAIEAALDVPDVSVVLWSESDGGVYWAMVHDSAGFALVGGCPAEVFDKEIDGAFGDDAVEVIQAMIGTTGAELREVLRLSDVDESASNLPPIQLSPDAGGEAPSGEVGPMVENALPTNDPGPMTFPEITSPPGLIPRRIWVSVPAESSSADVILCARSALALGSCGVLSLAAAGELYTVSVYDSETDPGPIELVLASTLPAGGNLDAQIVLHTFAVDDFADSAEPVVRVTSLPQEVIDGAYAPDEAVRSSDELGALVTTERE